MPSVVVQIQDAFGNLVDSSAAVTLTAGAPLGGGTAAAVHGVVTYSSLSMTKAGSWTLSGLRGRL